MRFYSKLKSSITKLTVLSILVASIPMTTMAQTYSDVDNLISTYTYNNMNAQASAKVPTKVNGIKELEKAIEAASDQLITTFTVKTNNISYSQADNYDPTKNQILSERINAYQISGIADGKTNMMREITIDLTYKKMYEVSKIYREPMNGYTISPTAQQVFIKVKSVLKTLGVKDLKSDYEKEKVIHDYIVQNTNYTEESRITDSSTDSIYGVEGVLLNGDAVCQGYAETMKLFMDILGIECKVVTGMVDDNQPHAWNLVKLDNEWYHVDATWNDPDASQPDYIGYSYFNVTDEIIKYDHQIDAEKKYPVASGKQYFYYKDATVVESNEAFVRELIERFSQKAEMGEIYCSYNIDIDHFEEGIEGIVSQYNMDIKYTLAGKLFTFEAIYG